MTWQASTQNRVLGAIEHGHRVPKDIAHAANVPVSGINIYLARLDTLKKIRRDGKNWVPYKSGLALLETWK